jgi:hypothetical protein
MNVIAISVPTAYITRMTKADLLAQLENAKNNLVLGLAGAYLLQDPTARAALKTGTVSLGAYNFSLDQVSELMAVETDRDIALKEFILAQFRALIKESFELLLAYAEETQQNVQLKAAANYQFWRMVRNSLSHDAHWRFRPHDLARLPISWNGATLTTSMQNQPFKIDFLGYDGFLGLHMDMADFARTGLS